MNIQKWVRKAKTLRSPLARPGAPAVGGLADRTTITRIFRNPPQLRLLARLLRESGRNPLRVAIYGVADGAEAVSLLIALDPLQTGLAVEIAGFDIADEYLTQGRQFVYTAQHFDRAFPPSAGAPYLEPVGDSWRLAARWQPRITLAYGNVLAPGPPALYAACDLVMCQNTLISLPPDTLNTAVTNLAALLRPGGLLAVGGGPLDILPQIVSAHGFAPLLDDVAAIHENWLVQRQFYNNPYRPYWALEPFNDLHPAGLLRYATIFHKTDPDAHE